MYTKMTLSTFNSLPLTMKAHLVYHNGKHLIKKEMGKKYEAHLYHMPGFFAEITRYKTKNKITAIRGFDNDKQLLPFLREIDIEDLM